MNRKKMKFSIYLAACSFAFCLTGCAGLPKSGAAIVEAVDEPLRVERSAGKGQILESEACNYNVLGIVAVGDASVEAAAQGGNIKNITELRHNLLGLNLSYLKLAKNCTVVRGTN